MAEQSSNDSPEPVVDTLDVLNEEDTDEGEVSEPISAEEEPEPEKESESETEEKEEIKLVEESEEIEKPLEETDLVTPARRKEILKKYPTIFKDFPYLEKAYYRDRQFTETFGDIENAKEALGKAESFDQMEKYLMDGSATQVLQAVKQANPDAFNRIADTYLTSLMEADQQAYYNVIGNVVKQTVATMLDAGKQRNDEILQEAARVLNQFVFNTQEIQRPTKLSRQQTPETQEIERERQQFTQERFQTTLGDLENKVGNILRSTISQNIDPKQAMSDYIRRNASRDAYAELESLIDQDAGFRRNLDKLWEKAFESRFSKQAVDAIRSAYLSKAKTLLPRVIQKTRNEALRGMGKRVVSHNDESEESTPIEKARMRSAPPSNSGNKSGGKSKIPQGMSNKDYIMSD